MLRLALLAPAIAYAIPRADLSLVLERLERRCRTAGMGSANSCCEAEGRANAF